MKEVSKCFEGKKSVEVFSFFSSFSSFSSLKKLNISFLWLRSVICVFMQHKQFSVLYFGIATWLLSDLFVSIAFAYFLEKVVKSYY